MIESNRDYWGETFSSLILGSDDGVIEKSEFDGCTFKGCSFIDASFHSCRFIDCTFEGCDLTALKLKNSSFRDVSFNESKCVGINWFVCQKNLTISFSECNIDASSFYNLDLRHLKVIACSAKEADFSESDLSNADFSDTDLTSSEFAGAKLENADLSKARNYGIDPTRTDLKNAKFSLPEAISLLRYLPIKLV